MLRNALIPLVAALAMINPLHAEEKASPEKTQTEKAAPEKASQAKHAPAKSGKAAQGAVIHSLGETVVKMPLAKGVSLNDAAESMKLRANGLNMKLVAELPLSKQVEAITGKPEPAATIYQFCDAMTARQMLNYSLDFAAYLPCRIALVEDAKGQGWLVMMDLNLLINAANLQPALKAKAIEVRDNLENIMKAGANGDL